MEPLKVECETDPGDTITAQPYARTLIAIRVTETCDEALTAEVRK